MDITIKGIEYTVDLEKAKEAGLIVEKKKPIKRHIGQYYSLGGNCYIVSSFGDGLVGLINLKNGYRLDDAAKVESLIDITHTEWANIVGGNPHYFDSEPIKVEFTY